MRLRTGAFSPTFKKKGMILILNSMLKSSQAGVCVNTAARSNRLDGEHSVDVVFELSRSAGILHKLGGQTQTA